VINVVIILCNIRPTETVGSVSSVLDVHAASIFNVEVSRVSDSSCYGSVGPKLPHPSPFGLFGPKPLILPL
jgi:hypothetical protein